jgi:HK97 family phage portal protein
LGGDSFLRHVRNGAGGLAGLQPIHPGCVKVEWDSDRPGGKRYTATLADNKRQDFDASSMTQIMGPSLTGLRGMGLVEVARNSLGSAIAADRASAKMFSSGALHSGMVTPEEDVTEAEAKVIKESLNAKTAGWEHAGELAVINRKLKFTPWTMSMKDAQFLELRQFLIQEISRWTGVPASLLSDPGSVSTWGTGVEIQQRGLGRFTLAPWARRIEDPLSRLLAKPRFLEIDFAGLERGTPQEEIDLLIRQVEAGLMTTNEARRIRNMPPIEGGDVLKGQPAPQPEAVPA